MRGRGRGRESRQDPRRDSMSCLWLPRTRRMRTECQKIYICNSFMYACTEVDRFGSRKNRAWGIKNQETSRLDSCIDVREHS